MYNRREITRKCLSLLNEHGVYEWASVVVVDDASTDGTAEMIAAGFPDTVVLAGDGNLWWSGGIRLGMEYAMDHGADFVFWFNDDCYLEQGALRLLVDVASRRNCITIAQAVTPSGNVYGGHRKTFLGTRPVHCGKGEILPCDVINGNCVCIPRSVVERVGFPDTRHFPQYRGDSDYSLRAAKMGIESLVVGDAVCRNEDNWYSERSVMWLLEDIPMKTRWASFFSLRNGSHVGTQFWWCWKYWPHIAFFKFIKPYFKFACFCCVRALVPRRVLLRVVGSRSSVWQSYQAHVKSA